jgi:lipopolysaccharide biosynthesis protein
MEILSNYLIIILIVILLFIILNLFCKKKRNELFTDKNRICCLYSYYEKNELYKNNFIYFLKNGILDDVDYIIIINGKCSIGIPEMDNLRVYVRENKGYDFGAYSHGIKKLENDYDYYFFINTSVRGPYLKNNNKPWTDYFINLFNKDVKLVGTSINVCTIKELKSKYKLKKYYGKDPPYSHIQSMFFGMDNEYFNFLKDIDFFDEDELKDKEMEYVIAKKEIGLSQILLKRGYNINSILNKYKNLDYRILDKDINHTSLNGDPYYKNRYFGNTIDEYEAIFFKNNRNL